MGEFIGHVNKIDGDIEFTFDKFIEDIEKRERPVPEPASDDSPARDLAKRQREHPGNRIRFKK